ncbi:MAG: acyl-[acyl-carrier-protein]--UDP-N-acetylglucosamine O-acyltransferase [Betaproteobacteria bacterium RIFCSPLOWO2_12_FULL_62_13]|nr:MAG: acyl-[acyl-carrier-protein]--UDP-N-acetylglucosamine O-acyltransferase [Betaproteobacteria bacterium RIFCSPLOWO2_12_FULL_62_13]
MTRIHPTALVDGAAQLGAHVTVGPYSVVEADTVIGDGCEIASHAVIRRYTRMGRGNRIHEHAVIGGEPQDIKFRPCPSWVEIGDGNVIREGVTVHRGSAKGAVTRIGDGNMLMAYSHVAHDCRLGSQVTLANGALLAGFVTVEDRAFISGAVTVHQFCRVGRLAMISQSTRVTMDCLPFIVTEGVPGRARGVNLVGLRRAGFSPEEVHHLRRAFLVLRSGTALKEMLALLAAFNSPAVAELVRFIEGSKRGFAHPDKRGPDESQRASRAE